MPAANEMQLKSFKGMKTHSYNPEDYGKSLKEAHKAGHLPPKEEDIPLHRQVGKPKPVHQEEAEDHHLAHRHQTRSFDDLHKDEKKDSIDHKYQTQIQEKAQ